MMLNVMLLALALFKSKSMMVLWGPWQMFIVFLIWNQISLGILGFNRRGYSTEVELRVPTDIPHGRATSSTLPHSSSEGHSDEPNSITSSPNKPKVEDICLIAHDRLSRAIKNCSIYNWQ